MNGIDNGNEMLYGFWGALLLSGIIAAPILKLLVRMKSRQTISAHVEEHQAKQGTPTMGGLIIVIASLVTWLVLACFGLKELFEPIAIFAGFALIGFVDDYLVPRIFTGKRGLGWKQKILMELVIVLIPILLFEHRTPFATFGGIMIILGFANAFNFTDGMDGLAGSVGGFLLAGLLAIAFGLGPGTVGLPGGPALDQLLCVVLIATFIPFLFLNAPPAKVFMGDVGSLAIGAVIGLMFWRFYTIQGANFGTDLGLFVMSLVMCAELFPVPIQIASVKLRKKKVFFYTPIHHGFQKKGVPETRVVWHYALIQLILSLAAVCIFFCARSIVSYSFGISVVR